MNCQELSEYYELYALGVLEAAEAAEIDAHLMRNCEECHRVIARALAVNAGVLSLVDEERPHSRVKHRLLASLGVHKPTWSWLWAASAALLLIVVFWLGTQERQRTAELADARNSLIQVNGERDRLQLAMQFLSDPQTQPASFGRGQTAPPRGYVFLHPQLGVMLIASNLPAAGAGKTYEMWVIPKGGAPRPAGLFQADGSRGLHILSGPIDVAMLGVVAVTLEPAEGSAAPTTKPIIAATL
jgi:anti-sigma-K factor RskA